MRAARLLVDGHDTAPVLVADTPASRLRGMLGRAPLPPALLLRPANSVHGMGMRESLEVAVLDASGGVVATTVLRPGRMTRPVRGGSAVLEAPLGSFTRWGLRVGSHIETVNAPS